MRVGYVGFDKICSLRYNDNVIAYGRLRRLFSGLFYKFLISEETNRLRAIETYDLVLIPTGNWNYTKKPADLAGFFVGERSKKANGIIPLAFFLLWSLWNFQSETLRCNVSTMAVVVGGELGFEPPLTSQKRRLIHALDRRAQVRNFAMILRILHERQPPRLERLIACKIVVHIPEGIVRQLRNLIRTQSF